MEEKYDIRGIQVEMEHQPDGKKYPHYTKESYSLGADGLLKYFAYFGGMPIRMNHTDSTTWESGESGKKVLALLHKAFSSRKMFSQLKQHPDDAPTPEYGIYRIGVTNNNADSTYIVADTKGEFQKLLNNAFGEMIKVFRNKSGRPLKPGDLPQ